MHCVGRVRSNNHGRRSKFEWEIEFVRADGPFVVIMGFETVQALSDSPSAGLVAEEAIKRRFTNVWRNEAGTSVRLRARTG